MGLLDDAIREHLELKRQHGASEEEIERAEHEALTPARRDPGAVDPAAEPPSLEEVPGEPAAVEPTEPPPPPPAADALEEPTAVEPPPPPPPVDEPVYADEYAAEPAPA